MICFSNKMSQKTFIEQAKDDLRSSLIMFQHNIYPTAIYLLQQSNEKLAKENLHFGEIASIEDLKKTSHNTFKPLNNFCKSELEGYDLNIEKIRTKYNLDKDDIISPDLGKMIQDFRTATNQNIQINDWKKLNEDELKEIFVEFDELLEYDIEFEIPQISSLNLKEEAIRMFPFIQHNEFLTKEIQMLEVNQDMMASLQETIIKMKKLFNYHYKSNHLNRYLNLILLPHCNESRYPSSEGELKYFTYNQEHPLIKYYLKIHHYTEQAIFYYEKSIANY